MFNLQFPKLTATTLIFVALSLIAIACNMPATPTDPQDIVAIKAAEVVQALKARDMQTVATVTHPTQGVRFSPYPYVSDEDLLFTAEQLPTLLTDPTIHRWGYYDGSGEPRDATFAQYYEQAVYDHDYANAEQISINEPIGSGNMINNSQAFYPDSIVVEYHFPGFNPDAVGMDWSSLRLVFQETDGEWALVGIIHAGWTI